MSIGIESSGNFDKTRDWLSKLRRKDFMSVLREAGDRGVRALESATPRRSGLTAGSWSYEIVKSSGGYSLIWKNSNMAGATPLVILIQHGHGTGTGGYVEGIDFINPAMRPIFDQIRSDIAKAVKV